VPRGDNDYVLPYTVIVLLIILGALCLVICGYAIHRTFGFGDEGHDFQHISAEQATYMAEVRIRNMNTLAYEGRRSQ
ncbi:hypothetical protein C7974DRAFT_276231, partial [Boeremia exigua]|uniref:uncharacterized protein n=1 Tax=Boeremia exigua TaxID=749465 RepID=UPI001E8DBAE7